MDRKECILLRKHITDREQKEKAIVQKLLPFLKDKKKIGMYIPVCSEVDVYTGLNKNDFFVPKVVSETEMVFCPCRNLKRGAFGVLEPEGRESVSPDLLDVIVIPVVGFHYPYRMGYGKGYYDRYLKKTRALKIGVAFDCQETDFEVHSWDIPLDIIITETRILEE